MEVKNETFRVPLDSVRQQPKIEIAQEPFYLMEVDFYHLTKGKPKPAQLGLAIFLSSIGYLIILVAKLASTHLFSKPVPIEPWEWLVVCVGAIAGIIIYGISSLIPSDESRLKNKIKQHFKKSPRARQVPRTKP